MLINLVLILIMILFSQFINNYYVLYSLNILIFTLLVLGIVFLISSTIGILRLPDFYLRLHAANKGSVLPPTLILLSCIFYLILTSKSLDSNSISLSLKILLIINFIFLSAPTSFHSFINSTLSSTVFNNRFNKSK